MSYMGVRVAKNAHIYSVNLHGPLVGFPILPTTIRQSVSGFVNNKRNVNIITDAHVLAKLIADEFCDGDKVLWIEVIIQSPEDIIYTAVEERLSTNV